MQAKRGYMGEHAGERRSPKAVRVLPLTAADVTTVTSYALEVALDESGEVGGASLGYRSATRTSIAGLDHWY